MFRQRKPDVTLARATIGWAPAVGIDEGLARTVEHFRQVLAVR